MAGRPPNFASIVESRFPGLIAEIAKIIRDSERELQGTRPGSESFLWEHTRLVAALACRLAKGQHLDPLLPAVAALFHDAGKFSAGSYHEDDIAEEEAAARIAAPLLHKFGMKSADVNRVTAGLKALYNEKSPRNPIAAIVHDADFLCKFGALGVANFFVKSTLRGCTIGSAILGHLSKELTYASSLPLNMRTAAGRRLAAKKAADSMRFFASLVSELRDAQIADLKVSRLRLPDPDDPTMTMDIRLVASATCPRCGGRWMRDCAIETGVKCRKLRIDWVCRVCRGKSETSFCLPEIAPVR